MASTRHNVCLLLAVQTFLSLAGCAATQRANSPYAVRVNKCCEKFEVMVDQRCTHVNETNSTVWTPVFTSESGVDNVQVPEYRFAVGRPDCGSMQMWPVYHYQQSADKLVLLPDGKLRHYIKNPDDDDDFHKRNDPDKPMFYDFEQGQYCMEKFLSTKGPERQAQYAMVCTPEKVVHWTDSEFLLRKIINPICHGISIIVLLTIAIIYFVLPTLRDLVGNIVTTITICLIIGQAANLVCIYTELSNHVSFIAAEVVLYCSLLGAFFWLNSMGYYIWKNFSSRNVFLRVTDGRKYCWHSGYAWSSTILMGGLIVFAHFFLDTAASKRHSVIADQETMGWLGNAVFFATIVFIIIVNIFFYVSTTNTINRMNTYGRIHYKLKANFVMFSLLFLIMSVTWLFLIMAWSKYDGLMYAHIITNALQAPLILYVCVLRQKHVLFLLKKTCCYNEPTTVADWGEEMTYMNGNDY